MLDPLTHDSPDGSSYGTSVRPIQSLSVVRLKSLRAVWTVDMNKREIAETYFVVFSVRLHRYPYWTLVLWSRLIVSHEATVLADKEWRRP